MKLSRHWEFLLLQWLGIFIVYTLRVNISVAVVSMGPDLGWTEVEESLVLSAFYWGYVAGQIPTAMILQRDLVKCTTVFCISIFLPSFLTIIVPWAAKASFPLTLLMRCAIGLFESASFPTSYYFFTKWYPERERVVMVSTFLSASYFGEIIGFGLRMDAREVRMGVLILLIWLSWIYVDPILDNVRLRESIRTP